MLSLEERGPKVSIQLWLLSFLTHTLQFISPQLCSYICLWNHVKLDY